MGRCGWKSPISGSCVSRQRESRRRRVFPSGEPVPARLRGRTQPGCGAGPSRAAGQDPAGMLRGRTQPGCCGAGPSRDAAGQDPAGMLRGRTSRGRTSRAAGQDPAGLRGRTSRGRASRAAGQDQPGCGAGPAGLSPPAPQRRPRPRPRATLTSAHPAGARPRPPPIGSPRGAAPAPIGRRRPRAGTCEQSVISACGRRALPQPTFPPVPRAAAPAQPAGRGEAPPAAPPPGATRARERPAGGAAAPRSGRGPGEGQRRHTRRLPPRGSGAERRPRGKQQTGSAPPAGPRGTHPHPLVPRLPPPRRDPPPGALLLLLLLPGTCSRGTRRCPALGTPGRAGTRAVRRRPGGADRFPAAPPPPRLPAAFLARPLCPRGSPAPSPQTTQQPRCPGRRSPLPLPPQAEQPPAPLPRVPRHRRPPPRGPPGSPRRAIPGDPLPPGTPPRGRSLTAAAGGSRGARGARRRRSPRAAVIPLFLFPAQVAAPPAPRAAGGGGRWAGLAARPSQSPAKVCEAAANGRPAPARDRRLPRGVARVSARRCVRVQYSLCYTLSFFPLSAVPN
ncbi:basic proline-rich protein-like [Apus apus]|uniref:basic proline-rich protein-like n=1 Tax=Apus apus TaxID=8895 RepID=UPI0021F89D0D|nr:basic proline-rich protein-like [Apus apus]